MRPFDLKEKAPALLLVLASVILAVTFSLPVGRRSRTRYQPLAGFVGAFEVRQASATAPALVQPEAPRPSPVAPILAKQTSPSGTVFSRRKSLRGRSESGLNEASRKRMRRPVEALERSASVAPIVANVVAVDSSVVMEKAAPAAVPVRSAPETADSVADSYENDLAKYLMDRSAAQGAITLSLCGLSRQKGRYILKVSVNNRGGEDFFVKDLSVRDGQTQLNSKFFFRLFVEPGRTREGFVVFDVPRNGADVHVALKEDGEKGRAVELSLPYSF